MSILWRPRLENLDFVGLPFAETPPLIQRLLLARGLSQSAQLESILSTKPSSLADPCTLLDMNLATARLIKAFELEEKICVYADFDLDGTSGLALMLDGLAQLGFKDVVPKQPGRLADGYGFHPHIVEDLAQQGVKLIVTVDVGITAMAAAARARELGIDVIITDHHQVIDKIPEAIAVVNPNRPDDTSSLGYLCGAGVAFYLLRALKRSLVDKKLISEATLHLQSLLDCFAIATLTDMVPLIEDNRVLVRLGLKQLELTKRPGLRSLLENLGMADRPLSGQDVAIRFAPKLNALSRMDGALKPIDLYVVSDVQQAEGMIKQVLESNSNRVQFQEEGEQEAFALLKNWTDPRFVFISSPLFHRGIIGLIATKLAGATGLPTFIGSKNADGVITGSGRMPNGKPGSLVAALEKAEDFLVRFGGHEAAAGFELIHLKEQSVIEKLSEYYAGMESSPQSAAQFYDIEARADEIDETSMQWLDRLGPFGTGFALPVFRINRAKINDVFKLRGGHLRIRLEDIKTGKRVDGIYFSPPPRVSENLPRKGDVVDLIAEIQWNYFGGAKSVQILIRDIIVNIQDQQNETRHDNAEI